MKPRARRVTIAAAVLGAGVIAVLVIAHWGTVRDHLEAWRFQLTRETETIEPRLHFKADDPDPLSNTSFADVVRAHGKNPGVRFPFFFCLLAECSGYPVIFDPQRPPPRLEYLNYAGLLQVLADEGARVVQQRFPRRAYVVIRDEHDKVEQPAPPGFPSPGILLPPLLLDEPEESDPTQELLRKERYR